MFEPTLFVLDLFQDGMKAVLKSVRLEELLPRRGAKQKPRGACLVPRASSLDWLDFAALRFLANVERTAVFRDVLANFEAERFSGPQRATAPKECVMNTKLSVRTP